MLINKDYIDSNWIKVERFIEENFGKKEPDSNAILFLIGIQESGKTKKFYSKEEKQDLIHVGICAVFSLRGNYKFSHFDNDRWPHYTLIEKLPHHKILEQELLLREVIITYFENKELI